MLQEGEYLEESPDQSGGGLTSGTDPVGRLAPAQGTAPGRQPAGRRIEMTPTGGANLDPVGSPSQMPSPFAPTSDGTDPNAVDETAAPIMNFFGGGSNQHGPGSEWTMGAGQGCAPGYVQHMLPNGNWTCISQAEFDKLRTGDQATYDNLYGKGTYSVAPSADGQSFVNVPPSNQAGADDTPSPSPTSGPQASGGGGGGGGNTIDRLIDLVSAQYAGAGVKGQGTGFDGLVSGPLATATEPAPKKSSGVLLLVFVIIGGAVAWYVYKKRKGAA